MYILQKTLEIWLNLVILNKKGKEKKLNIKGRNSQSSRIADLLRKEIFSGSLNPGDKLEGEYLLADHFHVGRQVIRSAIKILKEENLLRSAKGSGVYVNDYIPPVSSGKAPVRIGYVYYNNVLKENSFIESYPRLLQQAKEKNCELYFGLENHVDSLLQFCRNYKLDGLLLGGYIDNELVKRLHEEKILFLLLGNYRLDVPCNILGKDVLNNTRNAVSILLKKYRFTRIGGIFSNMIHLGPLETLEGIKLAAEENKVPYEETLFLSAEGGSGYPEMKKLFQKKIIDAQTLLYLSDQTFSGAARAIFEENPTKEALPYLFLDKGLSSVPYPELVGCFLYTANDIAEHSLDTFLDLYHGKKKQFWQGYAPCRINITEKK